MIDREERNIAAMQRVLATYVRSLPKPHFSPAVSLGPSPIAGYGLIAERAVASGEILAVERGPRVDAHTVRIIEEFTGYETNCCVGWGVYTVHAPVHDDGSGAYINHSCDPNAGMIADATWAAMRPIAAGEEVTCDYGTFETMAGWQMTCRCGSSRCRRFITAHDYRLPDLRLRLGAWYAPYLRVPASGQVLWTS